MTLRDKSIIEAAEKYYYEHMANTGIPDRETMIEMFIAGSEGKFELKEALEKIRDIAVKALKTNV